MKRFLLLGLLIFLYSCGSGGSGSTSLPPQNTPDPGGGGGGGGGAAASITLTANPSSLTVKGTSSVTATVLDSAGANVPDGTKVYFTLSDPTLGTITSQATTFNGMATALFTALNTPGTVVITATSGSVSSTISITISAATTGSIEFVSATPQVIGIKGSGQTEVSKVKFLLKDANGNPVLDGVNVSFTMNGPSGGKLPANGGEYIGDSDSTPTTATASTVNGYATVMLHSGNVAGPVTIIATVTGSSPVISSSSAVISIGGGVPSARHLNLATSKFNLAGFSYSGLEATITAYIADRFGNYNVLTGTSVSFYTEAGAIDRQGITDSAGKTSVVTRTQSPMPADVAKLTGEAYYTSGGYTYNPRDGWVTILATVQGEEAFKDANGNGLYDSGETFTDLEEPFYDKNDDGCYNNGTTKNCSGVISASTDPFEEYVDVNGNGVYDGPNGVWDGLGCTGTGCLTSKMIWDDIKVVYTGSPTFYPLPDAGNCYNCNVFASGYFAVAPASIAKGSSGLFTAIVADSYLNTLEEGTEIKASATVGTIAPSDPLKLPDVFSTGPTQFSFYLDIGQAETKTNSLVTVTVNWRGADYYTTISVPLVPPPITFTGPSILPAGTVGTAYTSDITVTGGVPYTGNVYVFNLASGSLPPGLSLAISGQQGHISGTPTTSGSYSFTVRAIDSVGSFADKTFSITINP